MEIKIQKWIQTVVTELSKLENDTGNKILETCGKMCSNLIGSSEKASEMREIVDDPNDIDQLLNAFKQHVFKDSPLYRENGTIYLEYLHKTCPCPLVNEGNIDDSFICNCTVGHTKAIFGALLNKPVNIELKRSILKGDDICQQAITIE